MTDHSQAPTPKPEAVHTIQSHPQGVLRPMGKVVALMNDLFFQMKVLETAKHVGVEFKVAATPEAFFAALESAPKLVIIDLNAAGDPVGVIQKLRAEKNEIRIVAFLSHVQRDLAAQAQAAGSTEVLPRSAFTQNLAAILSTAKD